MAGTVRSPTTPPTLPPSTFKVIVEGVVPDPLLGELVPCRRMS